MSAAALLLALAAAQAGAPTYFPTSEEEHVGGCDPDTAATPMLGRFESNWFSKHLRAAGEPSLYAAPPKDGAIRFTWLRTFHAPVTVRVERVGGDAPVLVARLLSGKGGYDPGTVAKSITRPLPPAERDELRAAVARTGLFDAPAHECTFGMDGAEWIMERADAAGYRLVKRWTPKGGPVREIGTLLLGMTGWTFDEVY